MTTDLGTRRWWALGAIVLSLLAIGFDATILNVALPTLATALHAGTGGLQWMVDAYILVFAGLLLPMGALGDRYGRKRLMMIGLAIFGASSVLATYASGTGQLIAARATMGVGAAILTPITLAVLPVLFAPHERAKAISFAAIGMGVGTPLGPIVGGYLLHHFWWGSVFLVNVPVALLGLVAIALLVPESRDPAPPRIDVPGAALSIVGLVGFVYGVIEAPTRGWDDPLVLASILAGLALLAAFVLVERRTREPMIDLALFARPRFLWGSLAATVASFALFGLLFVLPQYLQAVRGHDAMGTGVRLLPMMAGLIVGARASERSATRFGNRVPVVAGLLLLAGGLAIGAGTDVHSGYSFVAGWMAVIGVGTGLTLAPAMDAVLGELPPERSGSGSAVTMTLRQVAGALGVALLGSLLASAYTGRLPLPGVPTPVAHAARDSVATGTAVAARLGDPALLAAVQQAYVHAMGVVLMVCAGVALLGAAACAAFLPARGALATPAAHRHPDPPASAGVRRQPAAPAPGAARQPAAPAAADLGSG
jgi:EmrB/QacA subfamily drug resistance transporter